MRGLSGHFANAALGFRLHNRYTGSIHLRIEDGNRLAHHDGQAQLQGTLNLPLFASDDIGSDCLDPVGSRIGQLTQDKVSLVLRQWSVRSTALAVTSRPASSSICHLPWSNGASEPTSASIGPGAQPKGHLIP